MAQGQFLCSFMLFSCRFATVFCCFLLFKTLFVLKMMKLKGELQGARSNLQTILRIFSPLVRSAFSFSEFSEAVLTHALVFSAHFCSDSGDWTDLQVWGKLFSLGAARGRPGFFYFVAAALYGVQLVFARAAQVL